VTGRGLAQGIVAFEIFVVLYFLALNSLYLLFSFAAYLTLQQHRRRWTPRALGAVVRSPATPGISVIVPAYNEAFTVVETVRSLLSLNYPRFEIIVVNDGSTDNTLKGLVEEFGLVRAPASFVASLPSRSITAAYKSLTSRELIVLDKEQGGKSDTLNAGINVARYPLVCAMDADSLLEMHSLTRMVLPFLEDPDTVAVGGIVRIANGCTIESGRVAKVSLPDSRLARFQVVEYLRAFLAGRVAWSLVNGLLIVSGAFGVFRRDVLVEAGGFRSDTVTEDMELIVRLHRWCRERGQRYRIVFQPDPVCWTEAPESLGPLGRQRNRWQRGMLQVLGRHKRMTLNPRYGFVGLVSFPYHLIFEALGPLVEISGYLVAILALALGLLDWRLAQLFFLAAVVYGTLISLAAVALEELSFRKYSRVRDLLTLTLYGCLENFGYRQLTSWWRIVGLYDFLRHRQHWGPMARTGFGTTP
jgi:cellulose synthase/poly-beta-1,6-N-acetylglucosamine synthase-like glycosyltransferase